MAKKKLIENFIVHSKPIEIRKVQESMRVVELDGRQYSCIAAYTFPISRPGKKNLNNRIYGYALWDRMIRERQGERKFGVCDHPADTSEQPDGSVLKTFCVWRNMRYSEDKKLVLMDCYAFGEGTGQHFVDAIRAGGMPGFSSVGYGDFLEDGVTIDPETYELDRPADWVMNPSYEVFGSIEDEIQLSADDDSHRIERREDTSEGQMALSESAFKTAEERTMDKMVEQSYRLQIRGLRKEADAQTSVFGKLEAYKNILPFVEDEFFKKERAEVMNEIARLEEEVKALAEKGMLLESTEAAGAQASTELASLKAEHLSAQEELNKLQMEHAELQKKYDRLANLADGLKMYTRKSREMLENAQAELDTRFTAAEYQEMAAYADTLKKKLNSRSKKESQFLGGQSPKSRFVTQRRAEDEDLSNIDIPPEDDEDEEIEEGDHPLPNWSDEHGIHGDLQVDTRPDIISEPDEPSPGVLEYYRDLVRKNPEVKKLKKDILESRTVIEAQRTYSRLKSLIESKPRSSKPTGHSVTSRVLSKYRHRQSEDSSGSSELSGQGELPLREGWS